MIEIDGDYLEGGGQILRTSLSLSVLLHKPFIIKNIRAKRKNPGLQPQHLTAVRALHKISDAFVEGAELHSQALTFSPKTINSGKFIFDVSEVKESAGSVSLVLQAILLPLAFSGADSHVILRGGTHVNWSPSFEYLKEIFIPTVGKMGLLAGMEINRYGFYPIGGGEIEVRIKKIGKLTALEQVEPDLLQRIAGISVVANLPDDIARRQKDAALKKLVGYACEKKIETKNAPSFGKGTLLFLKAVHANSVAGFFDLGELGKKAEIVGIEAAEQLIEFEKSKAAVDSHLADQLLPYAVLAEGKTVFTAEKITNHLLTNAYTIKQFIPEAKIDVDGKSGKVEIGGIGFTV